MGATENFVTDTTQPDVFQLDGRLYSVAEDGGDHPSVRIVVEPHYRKGIYVHTYLRDLDTDWPAYKRAHAKYRKRKAARARLAHLGELISMLETERELVRQSLEH